MNILSKVAGLVIRLVIRLCRRDLDPYNPVHRSITDSDLWQE